MWRRRGRGRSTSLPLFTYLPNRDSGGKRPADTPAPPKKAKGDPDQPTPPPPNNIDHIFELFHRDECQCAYLPRGSILLGTCNGESQLRGGRLGEGKREACLPFELVVGSRGLVQKNEKLANPGSIKIAGTGDAPTTHRRQHNHSRHRRFLGGFRQRDDVKLGPKIGPSKSFSLPRPTCSLNPSCQ